MSLADLSSFDPSDPRAVAQLRAYTLANPDSNAAQIYCLNFPSDNAACIDNNVDSFYEYRVSLAANSLFLALFALSFLGFAGVIVASICVRRWRGTIIFSASLAAGVLIEIIGYAGRIQSALNQWKDGPFLMQIATLTIGPAFLAASLYLSLRRIVRAFGSENSRIRPEWYTRIFIPCDVISLGLQAAGGGIASAAAHGGKKITVGNNIMIAGLVFQCVTLAAFILVSVDFGLRVRRNQRAHGAAAALDQDPRLVALRASKRFRAFLWAVAISTVLILWRSIFRAAELFQGWTGPIIGNQGLFIAFEGVLIVIAVFVLNVAHPAWCAPELFGSLNSKKANKEKALDGNLTTATPSETKFDVEGQRH